MTTDEADESRPWLLLDAFYEQDARRDNHETVGFGEHWTDRKGTYGLSWLSGTGEVILTCAFPTAATWVGALFDAVTGGSHGTVYSGERRVKIIAVIRAQTEVERRLAGWEGEMPKKNSRRWTERQVET